MVTKEHTLSQFFAYPRLKQYIGLEGNEVLANKNTYVGIEIELEHVHFSHNIPSSWNEVEDGSLKLKGKEFVSVPIKLRYLEVELQRLFGSIKAKPSSRCSVHVHLNVRDFTIKELQKFLMLYCIFEKSLFRISGNRWDSNYCVPLFLVPDQVNKFISYPFSNWYKYSALNLCPIFGQDGSNKYGTAEFRHMEGTTDPKRILTWVNIITCLKIAAKKFSLEDLDLHLKTMNTTSAYWWLAQEVFGKWKELITNQPTFKEDIESCITRTKSVFYKQVEVQEKKTEKEKTYEKEIEKFLKDITFSPNYTNIPSHKYWANLYSMPDSVIIDEAMTANKPTNNNPF